MLTEETTIGIYINGRLDDVLIVPDGHEYHLFLTGEGNEINNYIQADQPENLGSIVFVNDNWIYEGNRLLLSTQQEIASYIISY
jgi:hypothetical protein